MKYLKINKATFSIPTDFDVFCQSTFLTSLHCTQNELSPEMGMPGGVSSYLYFRYRAPEQIASSLLWQVFGKLIAA